MVKETEMHVGNCPHCQTKIHTKVTIHETKKKRPVVTTLLLAYITDQKEYEKHAKGK